MRRIRPLKKVLLGISAFFLFFLAGTQKANAAILGLTFLVGGLLFGAGFLFENLAERLVQLIANTIVSIIIFVGELFLRISAWFMQVGIELNSQLSQSPVIETGYNTLLSVANIALVIAIIAVAFMVMLRRANTSGLLIRFIIVALIINFGYYIMLTLIIEPVDAITGQIYDAINLDDEGGFYSTLGQSLLHEGADPTEVLNSTLEEEPTIATQEDSGGLALALALSLARITFVGVSMFILIVVMFTYAFMFLARYVALSFFIILFPVAVVFWIFPGLKGAGGNLWNQWFQGFTRWLLFAPIGLFFVWLGVGIIAQGNIVQVQSAEFQTFFATVANMLVVVGFLLGGLIVANKMSITGASYAQGAVNKAAQGVGKRVRKYTAGGAKYLGGRAAYYGRRAGTAAATSSPVKKLATRLQEPSSSKIDRTGGRAIARRTERSQAARIKEEQERIKGLSTEQIKREIESGDFSGPKLAARLVKLIKDKKAHKLDNLRELMEGGSAKAALERYGLGKEYKEMQIQAALTPEIIEALNSDDPEKVKKAQLELREEWGDEEYKKASARFFGESYDENNSGGFSREEHKLMTDNNREITVELHPGAVSQLIRGLKASDGRDEWAKISTHLRRFADAFDKGFPEASSKKTIEQKIRIVRETRSDPAELEKAERAAETIRKIRGGRRALDLGGEPLRESGSSSGGSESENE